MKVLLVDDEHELVSTLAERLSLRGIQADWAISVAEALGLPEGVEPLAFTPVGYPADRPAEKKRKPLGELVRHGRWS